jgi:hypothetical protein
MAQGVAEIYTMKKTKREGDSLKNKMCFFSQIKALVYKKNV